MKYPNNIFSNDCEERALANSPRHDGRCFFCFEASLQIGRIIYQGSNYDHCLHLPKCVIVCHFVWIHDQFFDVQQFQFWIGYPPVNDQMIVIIVVVLSSDKDEIAMSSSHPSILGSRFPRYGGIHAVRSMTVRGASRGVDVFFGRFHSKSLGGYL